MNRVRVARGEVEALRRQAELAAAQAAEAAEAAAIADSRVVEECEAERVRLKEERCADQAATCIQASRRGARARALLEEQRRAAVQVQRAARGRQARRVAAGARALRRDAEREALAAQNVRLALELATEKLEMEQKELHLAEAALVSVSDFAAEFLQSCMGAAVTTITPQVQMQVEDAHTTAAEVYTASVKGALSSILARDIYSESVDGALSSILARDIYSASVDGAISTIVASHQPRCRIEDFAAEFFQSSMEAAFTTVTPQVQEEVEDARAFAAEIYTASVEVAISSIIDSSTVSIEEFTAQFYTASVEAAITSIIDSPTVSIEDFTAQFYMASVEAAITSIIDSPTVSVEDFTAQFFQSSIEMAIESCLPRVQQQIEDAHAPTVQPPNSNVSCIAFFVFVSLQHCEKLLGANRVRSAKDSFGWCSDSTQLRLGRNFDRLISPILACLCSVWCATKMLLLWRVLWRIDRSCALWNKIFGSSNWNWHNAQKHSLPWRRLVLRSWPRYARRTRRTVSCSFCA